MKSLLNNDIIEILSKANMIYSCKISTLNYQKQCHRLKNSLHIEISYIKKNKSKMLKQVNKKQKLS